MRLIFPVKHNKRDAHLVELAKEAGHELGLKIQDTGSGGASDANTTAAMGIPTLDGWAQVVALPIIQGSVLSWIMCRRGWRWWRDWRVGLESEATLLLA